MIATCEPIIRPLTAALRREELREATQKNLAGHRANLRRAQAHRQTDSEAIARAGIARCEALLNVLGSRP